MQLVIKAYAKVNLTLEVLGRRRDGYHDIASIVQTVDLYDSLTLALAEEISLVCDRADLRSANNLAVRAAALLKERTGCTMGARIGLQKRIPVAAGLGGGSSDAAATLRGLNHLWRLDLSVEELMPLAAQLGSDVPFFLIGGTAMVHGRGERVRPLPPADLQWLVVLTPPLTVPNKTASLYSRLTEAHFTKGALTRKLEARVRGGGDVPPQFLFNAFDSIAFQAFAGLQDYWRTFESLGASEIHLAGSGPSMFAPVSRREVGTALQLLLTHRHGLHAFLVTPWHPPKEGDQWLR
jgi:4-diphosphocytidyl-2-C-methyl-D-erythritol kinase